MIRQFAKRITILAALAISNVGAQPIVARRVAPPVVIDGVLGSGEWSTTAASVRRFSHGWLLVRSNNNTLFVAIDLTADDHDDRPFRGINGDFIVVTFDVNGDGKLDACDVAYTTTSPGLNQVRRHLNPYRRSTENSFLFTGAKIHGGFGSTARLNRPHRVWELSVPLAEIATPPAKPRRIAIRFVSRLPALSGQFPNGDTPLPLTASPNDPSAIQLGSEPVAPPSGGQTQAVQRLVLPDGTLELKYPDGTRRQTTPSGAVKVILPDGREQIFVAIQTVVATPPAPPSEAPVRTWLDEHNDNLLDTIKKLLGDDQTSLANYLASEQGLSVYEKVGKRMRCIYYLITP